MPRLTQFGLLGLEYRSPNAYSSHMDDTPHRTKATSAGWLEILAESEAEADARLFVDGDAIMRELDESIARMEAKQATGSRQKSAARR